VRVVRAMHVLEVRVAKAAQQRVEDLADEQCDAAVVRQGAVARLMREECGLYADK
jgi:hypothetical protein